MENLAEDADDDFYDFYSRDARCASAGRDPNVSLCLSVCLSVTRGYCVKTKKASVMISSPFGSPMILVF